MARTLDLIRSYMFSHRMEPRAAGTGSDKVLRKFFTVLSSTCMRGVKSFISTLRTIQRGFGEGQGVSGAKTDEVSILSPIPLLKFTLYYKVDRVGCFYRTVEEY